MSRDTRPVHPFPTRRSSDLSEVLAWKPGSPMRREAAVVLSKSGKTLEALVDVAGKKLISLNEVAGAQANFTVTDFERSRSEEHTSELQSRRDLVCRLLLEKK